MSHSVEFHPEARLEADDARDWYAVEAPHMEFRFLDDFDRAIDWISTMPMACPPGVLGTRFTMLKSFPYFVHFGSVLTDANLGPQVKQLLREHPATYAAILREHFVRHLAALQV